DPARGGDCGSGLLRLPGLRTAWCGAVRLPDNARRLVRLVRLVHSGLCFAGVHSSGRSMSGVARTQAAPFRVLPLYSLIPGPYNDSFGMDGFQAGKRPVLKQFFAHWMVKWKIALVLLAKLGAWGAGAAALLDS